MADNDISLRPVVLRPVGLMGGNPFSVFSKGSGQALKTKQVGCQRCCSTSARGTGCKCHAHARGRH